jgi:hypothetical protein
MTARVQETVTTALDAIGPVAFVVAHKWLSRNVVDGEHRGVARPAHCADSITGSP